MTNLKKARKTGKIEDFIAEHEADPDGDLDKLDAVIQTKVEKKNGPSRKKDRSASSD